MGSIMLHTISFGGAECDSGGGLVHWLFCHVVLRFNSFLMGLFRIIYFVYDFGFVFY
jgi:hypothetical protein